MEFDKEIEDLVRRQWKNKKQPLLLSILPGELMKVGVEYKKHIGKDINLKAYLMAKSAEGRGFKVLEHPTQKAKIGLIPEDVTFRYDDALAKIDRSDVEAFVRVLSKLEKDQQDKLMLPASLLVKLVTVMK